MKLTLLVSAFAAAFLASAVPSFGQAPAPIMLNVAHVRVKPEHLQDFLDLERQVAGQIRKGRRRICFESCTVARLATRRISKF